MWREQQKEKKKKTERIERGWITYCIVLEKLRNSSSFELLHQRAFDKNSNYLQCVAGGASSGI